MTELEQSVAGDEQGPPPKDEQDSLKWRGDPNQTFSDWTVEIVSKRSENEEARLETFHVHKFVLAFGARRSHYFAKEFQNNKANCVTRMELHPLEAEAFPFLLDYLYKPEVPLEIETSTGTALHSLGCIFDMPHLQWDAKEFCKGDLSLETVATYYEHALTLGNDPVLSLVEQFVGKNITSIEPSSPLVRVSSPLLWLNASAWFPLEDVDGGKQVGMHLSQIVVECCKAQADGVDLGTFRKLTSYSKMPCVHPDIALVLCTLDDDVSMGVVDADGWVDSEIESCDLERKTDVPSLRKRCADALSQKWADLQDPSEAAVSMLTNRKPEFLVDLLQTSLTKAVSELRSRCGDELDQYKQETGAREAKLIPQLKSLEDEKKVISIVLESTKLELEQSKARELTLQSQLDEARKAKDEKKFISDVLEHTQLELEEAKVRERKLQSQLDEARKAEVAVESLEAEQKSMFIVFESAELELERSKARELTLQSQLDEARKAEVAVKKLEEKKKLLSVFLESTKLELEQSKAREMKLQSRLDDAKKAQKVAERRNRKMIPVRTPALNTVKLETRDPLQFFTVSGCHDLGVVSNINSVTRWRQAFVYDE